MKLNGLLNHWDHWGHILTKFSTIYTCLACLIYNLYVRSIICSWECFSMGIHGGVYFTPDNQCGISWFPPNLSLFFMGIQWLLWLCNHGVAAKHPHDMRYYRPWFSHFAFNRMVLCSWRPITILYDMVTILECFSNSHSKCHRVGEVWKTYYNIYYPWRLFKYQITEYLYPDEKWFQIIPYIY